MIIMPSFTVCSDDDDGLQKSSCNLSTHVAGNCETSAGNVTLAAIECERHPAHHECGGASAHYAEKVDDNFQPSESTEHHMHNEWNIGRRMLMMEKAVVGMKKGSWEDIVPINNMQISVDGRQSTGTSSIGLAHHQHDIQCADRGDEEEACLTPRTKEHSIPSEILICPPPPRKKRRSTPLSLPDYRIKAVRKQLFYTMPLTSASSSANSASSGEYVRLQRQHASEACQVVVNPPDLHTFPACIRALFFHD